MPVTIGPLAPGGHGQHRLIEQREPRLVLAERDQRLPLNRASQAHEVRVVKSLSDLDGLDRHRAERPARRCGEQQPVRPWAAARTRARRNRRHDARPAGRLARPTRRHAPSHPCRAAGRRARTPRARLRERRPPQGRIVQALDRGEVDLDAGPRARRIQTSRSRSGDLERPRARRRVSERHKRPARSAALYAARPRSRGVSVEVDRRALERVGMAPRLQGAPRRSDTRHRGGPCRAAPRRYDPLSARGEAVRAGHQASASPGAARGRHFALTA